MAFCHTPRIYNVIASLIWVRSFTESYFSDIDNIVPFENIHIASRKMGVNHSFDVRTL